MPPKSRSRSAKPQPPTQAALKKPEVVVRAPKQLQESIGAIKKSSRNKRTLTQQQTEAQEILADLKIQAPVQPVYLNEQRKRVRVEVPEPVVKLKPVMHKTNPVNPKITEKQGLRKAKSTQKINANDREECLPKAQKKSRSQARTKSSDPQKSGKDTAANQKPKAGVVGPVKLKRTKKIKAISETESEGPQSEFVIRLEALQSIGWQSPISENILKPTLKIVYPDPILKNTKSQRMSLLDNSNATQDEKDMRQIKNKLRETDSEFRDWEDAWKKLRLDTRKQMTEKHNKSWDNFKKMYDQRKNELFNLK